MILRQNLSFYLWFWRNFKEIFHPWRGPRGRSVRDRGSPIIRGLGIPRGSGPRLNTLFVSLSEELSAEKKNLQSGEKISWFFQKRIFFRKKLAIENNPPFWKIQKLFSIGIKSRNRIYIKIWFQLKNYHTTSSNQTRCVCRTLVN